MGERRWLWGLDGRNAVICGRLSFIIFFFLARLRALDVCDPFIRVQHARY